jgi:hypothetical protein
MTALTASKPIPANATACPFFPELPIIPNIADFIEVAILTA